MAYGDREKVTSNETWISQMLNDRLSMEKLVIAILNDLFIIMHCYLIRSLF
jgi:hypothetical protein